MKTIVQCCHEQNKVPFVSSILYDIQVFASMRYVQLSDTNERKLKHSLNKELEIHGST